MHMPPEQSSHIPSAAPDARFPLWRNVSFLLMWSSVAASGFGDRMIMLAAWALLGMERDQTQAASIQSGVYFFFFLPYLVFSPLGGWLADRWPRKWLMVACDEVRGLLLLSAAILLSLGYLGPLTATDTHTGYWIFGLTLSVGVAAAVFSPTRNATIPQIVPVQQLQAANAIVLGIAVIASMIGLVAGSRIIEQTSVTTGLLVGAGLFLGSGWFFAFMRPHPHAHYAGNPVQRTSEWRRLLQGVSYLRHHRRVRQLVWLNVLFWAAANVFVAALAALCKTRYGIPLDQLAKRIADLGGATGVGMLAGSLAVAWLNCRRESHWLALLGLLATAGCMIAVASTHSFLLGLALAALTGFFGNAAMICVATLTQSLTPDRLRGRVFGVREWLTNISILLVNGVVWRAADADRWMIPALWTTALVLALVALVGLLRELPRGPHPDGLAVAAWRVSRLFALVWHRLDVRGAHHVPKQGAVILASNHTTALDPLLIQARLQRPIVWMMLQTHLFKVLAPLWRIMRPIALAQDGSDVNRMRALVKALRDGALVGMFPEGRLQRTQRELNPFAPGVALLARRSGAWIVPVWVSGTPRRQHMVWHFLCPSRSRVVFGRAYRPHRDWSDEQITADLRARLLALMD